MRLSRPIERYVRISNTFLGAAHRGLDLSAYVGTPVYAPMDAKANYTTGDLDTEAEIITALNAANATINSLLGKLEALGLLATS